MSCFLLDGSQLPSFEFFSFYENGPSKKNFPLRGPGFGGPEQGPGNARAARAQRAKRAMYLYTFFDLVFTASPKIALSCAFLHTPLERVEL